MKPVLVCQGPADLLRFAPAAQHPEDGGRVRVRTALGFAQRSGWFDIREADSRIEIRYGARLSRTG